MRTRFAGRRGAPAAKGIAPGQSVVSTTSPVGRQKKTFRRGNTNNPFKGRLSVTTHANNLAANIEARVERAGLALKAVAESDMFRWGAMLAIVALFWTLTAGSAWANTGSEFEDLYQLVSGWSTGYLGKTIAICFLLVGLGVGIIRGSVMAAVSAIAAGVALLMLPTIVDTMFTAGGV